MVFSLKSLLGLGLLGTAAAQKTASVDNDGAFLAYIAKHGKSYSNQNEFQLRKSLFMKKDEFINFFNSQPNQTMTVGHNKYSDWTDEEYKRILGYKSQKSSSHPAL
jgi:hypothetical protein